jgi:hypothetical protein
VKGQQVVASEASDSLGSSDGKAAVGVLDTEHRLACAVVRHVGGLVQPCFEGVEGFGTDPLDLALREGRRGDHQRQEGEPLVQRLRQQAEIDLREVVADPGVERRAERVDAFVELDGGERPGPLGQQGADEGSGTGSVSGIGGGAGGHHQPSRHLWQIVARDRQNAQPVVEGEADRLRDHRNRGIAGQWPRKGRCASHLRRHRAPPQRG